MSHTSIFRKNCLSSVTVIVIISIVVVGLIPGWVKPKIIKLVLVASPLVIST
jgi:hypothetical protein